jgi:phage-related protein (TIGR01555 family)
MRDALAKMPKLHLVDDPVAVIAEHATARFDSWQNDLTGQGTTRDKTTYARYGASRLLNEFELSDLYHGDDLAARIVDIVPDEMLRKGFTVDVGDPAENTEIMDRLEVLGASDKLANAIRWGRCFGGGGLLLGADDGRSAASPLIPEKARSLSYLYVFDRRYLWPLTWYQNPGDPKLGQVETYMVVSPSARTTSPVSIVHETRLVIFGGATTGIRERELNFSWDLSVLQRVHEILSSYGMGWNAASNLLVSANVAVFKMAGLADAIAAGGEDLLKNRLRAMDMAQSVVRALVIDAGEGDPKQGGQAAESYERQQFSFAGIPETLRELAVRVASGAKLPMTKLFGISPAGLNATGESDTRNFYDELGSYQTIKLAPAIRRIVSVMRRTKVMAKQAKPIVISFPPLWSEAPLAAAQTRKALIDGDAVLVDKGILLPEEIALQRFQPRGFDTELQLSPEALKARETALKGELDDLENPPEPPVESGTPMPAAGAGEASQFAIGASVTVNPGKEHMPEHKGVPGVVKVVEGDTYGVLFDGIPGVHRWYTGDELQAATQA